MNFECLYKICTFQQERANLKQYSKIIGKSGKENWSNQKHPKSSGGPKVHDFQSFIGLLRCFCSSFQCQYHVHQDEAGSFEFSQQIHCSYRLWPVLDRNNDKKLPHVSIN